MNFRNRYIILKALIHLCDKYEEKIEANTEFSQEKKYEIMKTNDTIIMETIDALLGD